MCQATTKQCQHINKPCKSDKRNDKTFTRVLFILTTLLAYWTVAKYRKWGIFSPSVMRPRTGKLSASEGFAPDPLTRASTPGLYWGFSPQTPVVGSRGPCISPQSLISGTAYDQRLSDSVVEFGTKPNPKSLTRRIRVFRLTFKWRPSWACVVPIRVRVVVYAMRRSVPSLSLAGLSDECSVLYIDIC